MGLRFDKDRAEIYKLLLELSTAQGLSDAAIASKLGVSLVTAGTWRRRLGIAPSDKFFYHFDLNYGEGAVEDFREMIGNGNTFAHIGRHFGFSRQRAQQIAVEHFFYETEKVSEKKEGRRSRAVHPASAIKEAADSAGGDVDTRAVV